MRRIYGTGVVLGLATAALVVSGGSASAAVTPAPTCHVIPNGKSLLPLRTGSMTGPGTTPYRPSNFVTVPYGK